MISFIPLQYTVRPGLLQMIRANGGLDYLIQALTGKISGRRGAEAAIAALVGLANVCTANNTIAIITTGGLARDIGGRFGVDSRRAASLLDTFSCVVQGALPYGAQLLLASTLSGVPVLSIAGRLCYPFVLFAAAGLSIWLDFPRLSPAPAGTQKAISPTSAAPDAA